MCWSRALAYLWAFPVTMLGLLFVPLVLLRGGGVRWVAGVLEVHGGAAAWFLRRCTPLEGGASAMTLGHVVLGRDLDCLERTRAHERIHVCQCERWGPLFIPAYGVASLIALIYGGCAYRDNWFEREAFESSGQ